MTYLASLDRTIAPSAYAEAASEFDAIVPGWEARLAQHDGDLIAENEMSNLSDDDGFHRGSIEEWDWFLARG